MLLKVSTAEYIADYKIKISFNDGISGIVDLKDKVYSDHRIVFKQLKDLNFFKNFTKNNWTIEWENGVELAPEFFHELIDKK